MKRRKSMKRTAHLLFSLVMLFSLLLPATPALAQSKGNPQNNATTSTNADNGKPAQNAGASASAGAGNPQNNATNQTNADNGKPGGNASDQAKPEADKKAEADAKAKADADAKAKADADAKANASKPADTSVKASGDFSGCTNGHSGSNPDGGGFDKDCGPNPASQSAPADTKQVLDGNNGCGQDRKGDAARETGTLHLGYDDNNGWCGKPHDVLGSEDHTPNPPSCTDDCDDDKDTPPPPPCKENCEGVRGSVDVNPAKLPICHRTGSDKNPWVLIEVSLNAQGHIDHDKFDLHPEDRIFWEGLPAGFTEDMCGPVNKNPVYTNVVLHTFEGCIKIGDTYKKVTVPNLTETEKQAYESIKVDMLKCEGTLGITDTPPPPVCTENCGGDTPKNPTGTLPVTLYGCFRKPDGSYQHYNMTFASDADKSAFERDNGLTVDASRPNPDQCKEDKKPDTPPAPPAPAEDRRQGPPDVPPIAPPSGGVLGVVDVEGNPPAQMSTVATTEAAPSAPAVITTDQARDQSPVVDVFPPARQLGIVSEQPAAPAAPVVSNAPQPANPAATQPIMTLLPTTGEPLLDLALLTLAFIGLTFLGLRFLRAGVRRA
ncbi:MAG TPA: hypothetical protein VFX49_18860 [Chloroflexota bacterium]|nr:hypothetical protein [Chloroflexota bacterium]